ncbi:hypothetical protein DQ04_09541050 [Trypanosoma grayi]|uniref:hypothetical protein n=1 Tax=Trypanosoma grayi TaxID=71804 RepID=UPI0004F485A2|nr:hypothetical protein DQ04_09541050 [Trypanosoma grayi]KEG07528.1 hypothetical protein DQ04_09541050 [Trypanosoma grayi]
MPAPREHFPVGVGEQQQRHRRVYVARGGEVLTHQLALLMPLHVGEANAIPHGTTTPTMRVVVVVIVVVIVSPIIVQDTRRRAAENVTKHHGASVAAQHSTPYQRLQLRRYTLCH